MAASGCGSDNTTPAATCSDGIKNGSESDKDCGGSCADCAIDAVCVSGTDCESGACSDAKRCVECVTADTCPGSDTECQTRTCTAGACGITYAAAGTKLAAQTAGDCQVAQCDDTGATTTANDDTDRPDDSNPCTTDTCDAGTPVHINVAKDLVCGTDLVCDGEGACVGCTTADQCPLPTSECQYAVCSTAGVCDTGNVAADTLTATQIAGDCKKSVCDGNGGVTTVNNDQDVADDGNSCTSDVCLGGVLSHPAVAAGTSCGGTNVCNGAGVCVGCTVDTVATSCPAASSACKTPVCSNNVCTEDSLPDTTVPPQVAGDCQVLSCSGGDVASTNDNNDVPATDNNPCTNDTCDNGAPVHTSIAANTPCNDTGVCNGSAAAPACVQCVSPANCPAGNDCQEATCSAEGACGLAALPDTTVPSQVTGDCKVRSCSGGAVAVSNDNNDVFNDGNECTTDSCNNGSPVNTALTVGAACPVTTGMFCNASQQCVTCATDGNCPAHTCETATCVSETSCSYNALCIAAECNVPSCSGDTCQPSTPSPAGTACGTSNLKLCDGAGACGVSCILDTDCPNPLDPCRKSVCASGSCESTQVADGTAPRGVTQPSGTCQKLVCDAAGAIVSVADDINVPVDNNSCTDDVCTAGAPSNPPNASAAATAICDNVNMKRCDATGACQPTVFVLRVGTGAAALSNASTAVYLDEFVVPSVPSGSLAPYRSTDLTGFDVANPITLAGNSTSEGELSRSADMHYLVMGGYAVAAGTAGIAATAGTTVQRTLARISQNASGALTINTSGRLGTAPFSSGNIRGVASTNGTDLWAVGSNTGTWYTTFAGTPVQLNTASPVNLRTVNVFDGQLYLSSASGTFQGVGKLGSGLPTTGGLTPALLTGFPTASGPSPYSFFMYDLNAGVTGVDTLYLADSRATTSSGGLQKWTTADGTSWTLGATYIGHTSGLTQITSYRVGTTTYVVGTTGDKLVIFTDTGSNTPASVTINTAATNTAYRGVALAPVP